MPIVIPKPVDLANPPAIDYAECAKALGIRPDHIPGLFVNTVPNPVDLLDDLFEMMGLPTVGGDERMRIAQFDQFTPPYGALLVDLVAFNRKSRHVELYGVGVDEAELTELGLLIDLDEAIAHELVHAKQYQDWFDEGKTIEQFSEYVRSQNLACRCYEDYRAIPEEAEAFELAPLYAHLVKIAGR